MTVRHSSGTGGAAGRERRSGAPPVRVRNAPAPLSATYDVWCCGCQIQDLVTWPPRTSATITAWSLDPWTKFLVPSTGSTVKAWSAVENRSRSVGSCA